MTMADFRSDRSPSPEGEGRAKSAVEHAFDSYYSANKAVNKTLYSAFPWIRSLTRGQVASAAIDTFGFWLIWQLFGGFEGLQKHLGMSRSTIYRRIAAFRSVFGEHPDTYQLPGVTIDVEEFIRQMATHHPPKDESDAAS